MNWDRVEGNWKELKGKVQQKWGKLTDDDLNVIEGKRTELSGRLQQRYGVAKDEAERQIDTWLSVTSTSVCVHWSGVLKRSAAAPPQARRRPPIMSARRLRRP